MNDWPTWTGKESAIEQLVAISRYYGSRPEFVLAGGGNTSFKDDATLTIKASGTALADSTAEGFVEMDRAALTGLLDRDLGADVTAREDRFKQAIMEARLHPERGQRPSVECTLHNLIPGRFVVHTHATVANMLTCCAGGEALARELFGDTILWVPYVDPGYTLARSLKEKLAAWQTKTGRRAPDAVLMASHGLIVCGDTPDEVRERTGRVLGKIEERLAKTSAEEVFGLPRSRDEADRRRLIETVAPALRALLAEGGRLKVVRLDDSEEAMALAGTPAGADVAAGGPLTPDQIVYCKSFPLWLDPAPGEPANVLVERLRQAVADHIARAKFPPKAVLVAGVGLFGVGDDWAAAQTVALVYRDAIKVMAGAKRLGGIEYMSRRDSEFIENWEVENYRRSVAAAGRAAGRAAGKVALVTGAAQGFGLEIAQDLARQGAHVVLADVNIDGAAQEARKLCAEHGVGRALGLAVNVTQGESVREAIHEAVCIYGGLDLLVSNAGVLRAESVKTQSERDFDFVTAVNYKGYYLCVQAASPVMAVQHTARPSWRGDIIQINSKSGLQGSNRNFAYAGSKFGGIGLTQSFALELVEDGIKVNSICPGNFFDGPLWSDPENGLFVQYLRTGKVPGAKTLEDVKKFYEAKVPMKRGCRTADVMTAIYYLMDQQYETGQAVPVTGGQVMLS